MSPSLRTNRLHSILLFVTVIFIFTSLASSACFSPDGKLEGNVEYVPCSDDPSNALYNICCATNRTPDRGPDICMPNGLCQVGLKKGETAKAVPAFTKPQCTNSNYDEPGCLHVCGTDNLGYLTPCDGPAGANSTRWCCGFEDTNCCSRSDVELISVDFADALANQTSSSSSSPSTPTPTPSTSQASSTISNPGASIPTTTPVIYATDIVVPEPNTGLSTGAKAGLGVGISLGALALVAGGVFLGRYLSTRKRETSAPGFQRGIYDSGGYQRGVVTYANRGEMAQDAWQNGRHTPVCELPVDKTPRELAVEEVSVEKFC